MKEKKGKKSPVQWGGRFRGCRLKKRGGKERTHIRPPFGVNGPESCKEIPLLSRNLFCGENRSFEDIKRERTFTIRGVLLSKKDGKWL